MSGIKSVIAAELKGMPCPQGRTQLLFSLCVLWESCF